VSDIRWDGGPWRYEHNGCEVSRLAGGARTQYIELSIHRIARAEDVAAAIDMEKTSGATALNILASPFLWSVRQLIMDRAAALHQPAIWQ
jgi:putative tryptophan/tyrosine transport system substrate-binding protein